MKYCRFKILLRTASIFFIFLLFLSQKLPGQPQLKGLWFQPRDDREYTDWQAEWIWVDENLGADMLLARRNINLEEIPQRADLQITASSQYQLYVNGEYVCRGPARSAPHHQSFDILDIQALLQKGNNCLAIRVHHQENERSYHLKGRAGLLAQLALNVGDRTVIIPTNKDWKVTPDPAWDSSAPLISRFQLVVNDRVDLNKQLKNWNAIEYDDDAWANATPLMRKVGWPSPPPNAEPQPLTPPWTSLLPREVPYLIEKVEAAGQLLQAHRVKADDISQAFPLSGKVDEAIKNNFDDYQKGITPLSIPVCEKSEAYFILFDLGQIRNGHPLLEMEGTAGTEVDILYAPFVVDQQFSHRILDSDFNDKIILSGNKDTWEATYFKPTRFLGLFIQNHKQPVKLYSTNIRYMEYPFDQKGQIHSTDAEWINRYMEATAKTIKVCTTDGYTDNYRERRQYAQTGYYGALGNYWLFGDHALQRRYLLQVAQEQNANGIMPAYAPRAGDDYMVIMDSNCLWLRSLRNYLLYSGDKKTVRELLPAAQKLLQLLHSYTDKLGLLTNPPYAYWLDHSRIDRQGANFCLNGHYLGALEDFAEVLDWLGEKGGEVFRKRASLLRQSLQEHLWDEQKGLFADALINGRLSTQFSEHANAMALAEKVATSEQAQKIIPQMLEKDELNYITRSSGMKMVTPAMSYFLHKGLCEYGQIDASFYLFQRRFDKMLTSEYNGTLWEEWWLDGTGRNGKLVKKTRSDAQTESAFPPALFGAYLLGIQPTSPGWKAAVITPQDNEIMHLEADIPTPEGILKMEWKKMENGSGELTLEIPGEIKISLNHNKFENLSSSPLKINGQIISSMKLKETSSLGKGEHIIQF